MASQPPPGPPSTGSSHRLPTVSAAHALGRRGAGAVATGLAQLDRLLAAGGYMRGQVTEMFGPPGIGKSAFGIQAAALALRRGQRVVWVDAACAPLPPPRLDGVLHAVAPDTPRVSRDELLGRLHHFTAPTLAHLLALLARPPASFPPPGTALLVVDSLNTLLDNACPRNPTARSATARSDAAARRRAIIAELGSCLARLAAMHDIALLLTCQTTTRIRGASRALLVPAISGVEWEAAVSTRLVLFRDWGPAQGRWSDATAQQVQQARFAGLVKANGVSLADEEGVGCVVPFAIDRTGLCSINVAAVDMAPLAIPMHARPPKRRFQDVDSEEGEHPDPDSDELYGWVGDDQVAAESLLMETQGAGDADTAECRADARAVDAAQQIAPPTDRGRE